MSFRENDIIKGAGGQDSSLALAEDMLMLTVASASQ